MPIPRTIENTADFSVRCFKPLYALNEEDYTPWFIGHAQLDMVSDEALQELFERWKAADGLRRCDGSPASGFADYLEGQAYVVFWSPEEWLWVLPVTDAEEQRCLNGADDDEEE